MTVPDEQAGARRPELWLVPQERSEGSGITRTGAAMLAGCVLADRLFAWVIEATPLLAVAGLRVLCLMFGAAAAAILVIGLGRRLREARRGEPAVAPAVQASMSVRVTPESLTIQRVDQDPVEIPRPADGQLRFEGGDVVAGEVRASIRGIEPDAVRDAVAVMGWGRPVTGWEPSGADTRLASTGWQQPAGSGEPRDETAAYQGYAETLRAGARPLTVRSRRRWRFWPVPWGLLGWLATSALLVWLVIGSWGRRDPEALNLAYASGLFVWFPWALCLTQLAVGGRPYGRWEKAPDAHTLRVSTDAIAVERPGREPLSVPRTPAGLRWDARTGILASGDVAVELKHVDEPALRRAVAERGWSLRVAGQERPLPPA